MRPDVALISPYPGSDGLSRSGVGWYARGLAHALSGAGARVAVVAPHGDGGPATQQEGPVEVRRCFERGPTAPARAALAALATGAPVTHLQYEVFLYGGAGSVPALMASLAGLRAARRGPVVTMHQVVSLDDVDDRFTDCTGPAFPPSRRAPRSGRCSPPCRAWRSRRSSTRPALPRCCPVQW